MRLLCYASKDEQNELLIKAKMPQKILVTYASRTGTTNGVADAIGQVLTEKGFQTDVLPMQQVNNINQYDVIVAGSAIQAGKWLPEAIQFVQTNKTILNQKTFAVYLVCMTLAMKNNEKYRGFVSGFLDPVRSLVKPESEGLFAGKLDINKVPSFGDRIKFRLSVLFGVWKEADHRNWENIRAWAEELPNLF
jgi:menaquinone-dependent protoporphyrinogen oxidase